MATLHGVAMNVPKESTKPQTSGVKPMTYVTTTVNVHNNRKEHVIDLRKFALDLCMKLGGTMVPESEYPSTSQAFMIGADSVALYANNWKARVDVSISAPDVKHGDRDIYTDKHKTQSASVNPDGRAIGTIAADIKRRVIDASQEALRLQREHATFLGLQRSALTKSAAALQKATGLDIKVNEQERRAAIWGGKNSHYISATLHTDNTVAIERIGSVTAETFAAIVQLLNRDKASQE